MTPEQVAAKLALVDSKVRSGKPAGDDEKQISLAVLYNDLRWGGPEATPLPSDALVALVLEDMTSDARWARRFINNVRELGLYRTRGGNYWLLAYDAVKRDHVLQLLGTAGDATARFS